MPLFNSANKTPFSYYNYWMLHCLFFCRCLQDWSVCTNCITRWKCCGRNDHRSKCNYGFCVHVYCIHTCICQLYVHMHCTRYILPIHSWLGIKLVLLLNCRMRQSGLHMKQYLHQTVIPDQVIKSSSLESQGLLFRGHQRGFGPTNLIVFSRMSYTLSKSRNLGQEQVPSYSLMNFSSVSTLYSYISLL